MTFHRVDKLEGALLDAAVAKAEGARASKVPIKVYELPVAVLPSTDCDYDDPFEPSSRWEHGGPIIERERGRLEPPVPHCGMPLWTADMGTADTRYRLFGPTPLIAAMRAYVASKFGEEVDL